MDSTKRNKIEAVNVNAHLHTPYSFSAFGRDEIIWVWASQLLTTVITLEAPSTIWTTNSEVESIGVPL